MIQLETSDELTPLHLSMLGSEITKAGSLHKGEQITVRCTYMRRIVGLPVGSDCTFLQANVSPTKFIRLQSGHNVLKEI